MALAFWDSSECCCTCSIWSFNYCSTLMCCLTSPSSFISICSYPSACLSSLAVNPGSVCFSEVRLERESETRSTLIFSNRRVSCFYLFLSWPITICLSFSFSDLICAFLNFSYVSQLFLNNSNSSKRMCINISTDYLM